tara:strand:+ start:111 stop:554 length:444 start_codon:yes stop_codon:yes gene_type:complete
MLSLGPWVNDLLLSRIRHQQNRPSQKRQAVFFKLAVLYILIYIDRTLILIEESGMTKKIFMDLDEDTLADMIFDINDVLQILQYHPINQKFLEDYSETSFEGLSEDDKPKVLADLPKDFEGSSLTIGDCCENIKYYLEQEDLRSRDK